MATSLWRERTAARGGGHPGDTRSRARCKVPHLTVLALAALSTPHPTSAQPHTGPAGAQATEVIVLDLSVHQDHVHAGSLTRLTAPGTPSRDPDFLDLDRVLFLTTGEANGDELREHTLSTGEVRSLGVRPERLRHPRTDPSGRHVGIIQSDAAGASHLFVYPEEGGVSVRVLPDLDDVVGFAWVDEHRLVVVRGEHPRSLDLVDLRTGVLERLRDHVGRTVASIPGSGDVSFVDERDPGQPTLRRWRVNRGEDEEVAALPDPESMHAWFSPYTVFLLHEGILYRSTGDPGRPWHPMLTELDELVGRASAFAVSPGTLRIAVVVGLERR